MAKKPQLQQQPTSGGLYVRNGDGSLTKQEQTKPDAPHAGAEAAPPNDSASKD